MMVAPAATAARATAALPRVDRHPDLTRASASTTGSTRRSSSASGTGSGARPGRLAADVDDVGALGDHAAGRGPTAAAGSNHWPPSENESGVTLSTPITRVTAGRVPARPARRSVVGAGVCAGMGSFGRTSLK